MSNIVIVGASGHAKVIIDIVQKQGKYNLVGLLDRVVDVGTKTMGYPVLGKEADLPALITEHDLSGVIIAIGDNFIRSKVAAQLKEMAPDIDFVSAIHPTASIASDVTIGEGTVIMAGAVVNSVSAVGRFCILNTNSSLDHDSVMGDFASLAPGVVTGGNSRIGEYSALGIGTIMSHGLEIGEHTVTGAGSIVISSIESYVVAYGNPAAVIRTREKGEKYL